MPKNVVAVSPEETQAAIELAEQVTVLGRVLGAMREDRDDMLSRLGQLVRATGKKSAWVGDYQVKLADVKVLRCLCHHKHVSECEAALEGQEVRIEVVYSERAYVRHKAENEEAVA